MRAPSTRRLTPATEATALGAAVFLLLLLRNLRALGKPIRDAADFAANDMLIDRAEHLHQLVGNYSRVKFHHPGPVFLYVGAIGQAVFHQLLHLVPADFNGQLVAFFVLNAVMAALAYRTLRRHVPSAVACAAGIATAVVWVDCHVALAVPWFPYLYVLPFLLFALAAASVLVGEAASLPVLVLAGGFLVHGHISFTMFVVVTTLVVVAGWWLVGSRPDRRAWLAGARRPLVASGVVLAVFLLPMVLDVALHWPGQWTLYWKYSRSASTHSLGAVLEYASHFWTTHVLGWIGLAAIALLAIALAARVSAAQRRFLVALVVVLAVLQVLTIVYALRGVDELADLYTGDFSTAIPGLLLGVAAMLVVQALASWRPALMSALAAVTGVAAAIGLLVASGSAVRLAVYPQVEADIAHLQSLAGPGRAVVLDFGSGPIWPKALAVLEEAHRRGVPICIADPAWSFIVAPQVECTAAQQATGLKVQATYVGPTVPPLTTVTWSRGHLEYTPS